MVIEKRSLLDLAYIGDPDKIKPCRSCGMLPTMEFYGSVRRIFCFNKLCPGWLTTTVEIDTVKEDELIKFRDRYPAPDCKINVMGNRNSKTVIDAWNILNTKEDIVNA